MVVAVEVVLPRPHFRVHERRVHLAAERLLLVMTVDAHHVQPTQPLQPTWKDDTYSCTYHYKGGSLGLSVKELSDKAETDAFFASQAQKLGKTQNINGLGQGAFTTTNKSAVVRKDYKVLLVDISGLPKQFGNPPDSRENIALNVAAEIMGCWTGA